jgi:hypothetical protein
MVFQLTKKETGKYCLNSMKCDLPKITEFSSKAVHINCNICKINTNKTVLLMPTILKQQSKTGADITMSIDIFTISFVLLLKLNVTMML